MAIAVPDLVDQDELARQAEAFDRKAEMLSAQARDLREQAISLRLAIESQKREPVTIMQRRVAPERDARLLARISDALGAIGPCTSTALADHINVSQARVRGALLHLEQVKAVKRSGIRRGTVWGLVEDEDLADNHGKATARSLVLAAGQKLDTFDLDTIDAELPMLGRPGVQRALRGLEEEGIFSSVRVDRRKVYAYEKPDGPHVPRPKHEAPEAAVVQFARRRGQVEGIGRRMRSGTPIVDELLRQLSDWPVKIVEHKHKYSFKLNDVEIAHCSKTPGASSLKQTRSHLHRAGIMV